MYQSFTIKNFRCFRELTISPLQRINLIAGMNNVGKTALLEAIFLHLGPNNPQLSLVINAIRGIEQFALEPEEIWGWLFYDKHINDAMELTSQDKRGKRRSLQIRLAETEASTLVPPDNGGIPSSGVASPTTAISSRGLILEYRDASRQPSTSRAYLTAEGKLQVERAQLEPYPLGVFLGARVRAFKDDADRFSKLDRVGRLDEVLSTVKLLEPRLRRLALLMTGGVPMVNGDIGLEELVPVPLMGEGIVRLLSIVLSIANARGGTVLIDEIENGLHYSLMVKVWKAIAHAARESKAQIFATTHSWECIKAAHEAFTDGDSYDFRLHRLERVDDEIKAVTYTQRMLDTAIATGLEVR